MPKHAPNNFDLLRLLLSLLVLYSHSFHLCGGPTAADPLQAATGRQHTLGMLAVDAFFAVSGFLITRSWCRAPGAPYIRSRVLRIYPAFWVAMAFCLAAASATTPDPIGAARRVLSGADGLFRQLLLYQPAAPDVPAAYAGSPYPEVANGSLWTLSPEVVCYAVVAAAGAVGVLGRRTAVVAFLVCWSAYANLARNPATHGEFALFRLATFFAAGAVLHFWPTPLGRWWPPAVALVAAALAAWAPPPVFLWVLPACLPLAVVAGGAAPRVPGTAVCSRIDLSYGVYLYAWPVQQCVVHYGWASTPHGVFVAALGPTLALATASWFLVERPMLRLKGR